MSHIVEFSITGLSGRKDVLAHKLNRDTNVFFGLNGSGKTSLLKILHSAMSNDTSILKNVAFKTAEVKIYSISSDKVFTNTIEQKPLVLFEDANFDPSEFLLAEDEEIVSVRGELRQRKKIEWITKPKLSKNAELSSPTRWQHQYLPTSRLYVGASSSRRHALERTPLSEEGLDLYFAESLQKLWSSYSSDILTAVRQAQEDGLANILKAVLSPTTKNKVTPTVDAETAFTRASAFLDRQGSQSKIGSREKFLQRYKDDVQLRSVVSDINEVEKRVEKAMAPRAKLQEIIEYMFSGNKSVRFEDKSIEVISSENNPIGLNTLSSGEKHLLRILIETLRAEESSALIDEPEISLHIDWQKQLIEAMRHLNPNAQLILATHSPEIMADLEDSKIFRI